MLILSMLRGGFFAVFIPFDECRLCGDDLARSFLCEFIPGMTGGYYDVLRRARAHKILEIR